MYSTLNPFSHSVSASGWNSKRRKMKKLMKDNFSYTNPAYLKSHLIHVYWEVGVYCSVLLTQHIFR